MAGRVKKQNLGNVATAHFHPSQTNGSHYYWEPVVSKD